jgi:hypothetical protein
MDMEYIKFKNDIQMFLSCDYQMKAIIYITKHKFETKHYIFLITHLQIQNNKGRPLQLTHCTYTDKPTFLQWLQQRNL